MEKVLVIYGMTIIVLLPLAIGHTWALVDAKQYISPLKLLLIPFIPFVFVYYCFYAWGKYNGQNTRIKWK